MAGVLMLALQARGVVLTVAAVWLAVRHYRAAEPSEWSKRIVVGLVAASALAFLFWPGGSVPTAVVQVSVCVYVILHQIVTAAARDPVAGPPDCSRQMRK